MADTPDALKTSEEPNVESGEFLTPPFSEEPSKVSYPDSDTYITSQSNRGIAIIFNHKKFDDNTSEERYGTKKDAEDLNEILSEIGFKVSVYDDLKYGDIYEVLRMTSKEDHSDHSCILIIALSHGESGMIYARDHAYKAENLWMPFIGEQCPSLAGKPKLFFIQACRGTEVDDGVTLMSRSLAQKDSKKGGDYTIPSMADILVMYSTYDGYFSWRSPVTGSWFIQSLCTELEENWKSRDLLTILTFVNRRMAIGYESYVPQNGRMDRKKQIGSIVSTLTRQLYFSP